jgi:hypothetical protein
MRSDVEEVKWDNMRKSVGESNVAPFDHDTPGFTPLQVALTAFLFVIVVAMELRSQPQKPPAPSKASVSHIPHTHPQEEGSEKSGSIT